MKPVGAKVDRVAPKRHGHRPAPDPAAGLEHCDREPSPYEPTRGGDPGGAGTNHDYVHVTGRPSAEARGRDWLHERLPGETGPGQPCSPTVEG